MKIKTKIFFFCFEIKFLAFDEHFVDGPYLTGTAHIVSALMQGINSGHLPPVFSHRLRGSFKCTHFVSPTKRGRVVLQAKPSVQSKPPAMVEIIEGSTIMDVNLQPIRNVTIFFFIF